MKSQPEDEELIDQLHAIQYPLLERNGMKPKDDGPIMQTFKLIKARNEQHETELIDFAIEVIEQWGYMPAVDVYTSGGLSTLETAFGILRRNNMLNKKGQFAPATLTHPPKGGDRE